VARRNAGRRDAVPWSVGAHLFRQRPRVRRERPEELASKSRNGNIEPGSPWESDTARVSLRDECLNEEIFYSLREAEIVIEKWRVVYNKLRPHSALG